MENINVGDKVVVRLRESYYSDGNARPIVQGKVIYVSPRGTYSVVNLGGYNVSYWNNEINAFDESKYRLTNGNRVQMISGTVINEEAENTAAAE